MAYKNRTQFKCAGFKNFTYIDKKSGNDVNCINFYGVRNPDLNNKFDSGVEGVIVRNIDFIKDSDLVGIGGTFKVGNFYEFFELFDGKQSYLLDVCEVKK